MSNQKRISFGYTRNTLKEIEIYEEQSEVVKLIFELYSLDKSFSRNIEIFVNVSYSFSK